MVCYLVVHRVSYPDLVIFIERKPIKGRPAKAVHLELVGPLFPGSGFHAAAGKAAKGGNIAEDASSNLARARSTPPRAPRSGNRWPNP